MSRIEFKSLPNQTTPITGENLNKLNNLAIDTSVGTHEEEVVLVKSKNLAKYSNEYTSSTLNSLGAFNLQLENDISLKAGTYYFSASIKLNSGTCGGMNTIRSTSSGQTATSVSNPTLSSNYQRYVFKVVFSANVSVTAMAFQVIANSSNAILQVKDLMISQDNTSYEPYAISDIYANKEKYTDTLNIGVEPNNSGLWVEHSENIFNAYNVTYIARTGTSYSIGGTNKLTITGNNSTWARQQVTIKGLVQGKTYYLSSLITNSSGHKAGLLINDQSVDKNTIGTETSVRRKISFVAPSDHIDVQFYTNWSGTQQSETVIFDEIMLSTEDINYEPYTEPSIKVNNNGVYETIVNKNVYSTGEVVIGEWLGKPLYRKIYKITDSGTSLNIATGISNIEMITSINGFAASNETSSATILPNGFYASATAYFSLIMSSGNIGIRTTDGYKSYIKYITLEYTKTTD